MTSQPQEDSWKPELYQDRHSFVWKFGSSVIELLAPKSGERILDIGCGTGQLTAQIAESGASVVGIDHSPAMIEQARQMFPSIEFQQADARSYSADQSFDGVFSNAALHWIREPSQVIESISRSLKHGGRMAVEFGGHGNVQILSHAIETASQEFLGQPLPHPWYFPGIPAFGNELEQHGIELIQAAMIDRPTRLEGHDGLKNWVRMFGQHWLTRIPEEQHEPFLNRVTEIARPKLFRDSSWYADYRRIRVQARKT